MRKIILSLFLIGYPIPLVLSSCTNSRGVEYVFINGILVTVYPQKQKRPAHLSIV